MSINYALLGLLSWKPLTGYDVKKIIQESPFMYWSANNNQIYKALVQLLEEGYVTHEVCHQESSPSKKIYTITSEGAAELKDWVRSTPEPPEFKKTFLMQLAWADQLSEDELDALFTSYENELRMQIMLQQGKKERGNFSPGRTPREEFLWNRIYENVISSYKMDLEWIQDLRKELCVDIEKGGKTMNLELVNVNGKTYLSVVSPQGALKTEQDALELIAACSENETNLVLFQPQTISDDFFKLKTGLAGTVLQKLVTYRIKAAVIISDEQQIRGKFKELLTESKKGNNFMVFYDIEEAQKWLLN